MIEQISHNKETIALIIRHDQNERGIHFFTPPEFSQQLAFMNRAKGYRIAPHVHKVLRREVFYTQEVLFVRKGKVKIDLYDKDQNYLESRILETGDVILLASGGHGFEMLEQTEIIEVKQGPYSGDQDKTRFEPG